MALEMKVGDLLLLGSLLTFVLACVAGIFLAFDNSLNVEGIGSDIEDYKDSTKESTENTEAQLQTLITTDTGFKVEENIYIDERGDAESSLASENTKTTSVGFIQNIKTSKYMVYFDVSIWIYIISTIIMIGSILGLRAIMGNNRV